MTKGIKRIFIIIFVVLFMVTGCKSPEVLQIQQDTLITQDLNGVDLKKLNQYTIDVVFNPDKATIQVNQMTDYINTEDVSLRELYFHLYPNSYRKMETAPFLFDAFEEAYPEGFQPGYIDISQLTVNGKAAEYVLEGEGSTIMKIVLDNPLKSGERSKITMEYTVKLPPSQERFGYGADTFNFGNWYPVAAVYDETGWNLDPYYPIGDPFYSDVSNYMVTIDTPKDYTVAASGNIFKDEIKDDRRTCEIETKLMRDFAWVAGKNFKIVEKEVEGTVLKMYFIQDEYLKQDVIDFATGVGENSLKVFNRVFGKYPYGQYSVVQTNFPSGMEYPGIVFIGKQFYDTVWQDYLEIVIVHETAHQWWYGIVGNDEIDEAWLDESLAAYSEVVYIVEEYGEEQGREYHRFANTDQYNEAIVSIYNKTVLKPLYEFESWEDYGPLVYSKGAVFLNELRETYGKDKFYQIMSNYYNENRFKNATSQDFQKVTEEVTGENLDPLFNKWLLE